MARRPDCKHSERYLDDGTEVDAHDCDYVDARNALIPEAQRMAYETGENQNNYQRTSRFATAMNVLALQHGLIKGLVVVK